MSVVGVMAQRIGQSRRNAQVASLLKLQFCGDAVRLAEFEVQRFPAEQVGILLQGVHRVGAVGAVSGDGHLRGKSELCHPGDHFPHTKHPTKLVGDGRRFLGRDSLELAELLRRLGDDSQRLGPEFGHDLFGRGRPDVRQHPAGKVTQQRGGILRQGCFTRFGAELFPVTGMIDHITIGSHGHSVVHAANVAGNHNVAAAGVHLENGIAALRVFIDHMLHHAFQLEQFPGHIFLHGSHLPADSSGFSGHNGPEYLLL